VNSNQNNLNPTKRHQKPASKKPHPNTGISGHGQKKQQQKQNHQTHY
jgi:hypothetical protein